MERMDHPVRTMMKRIFVGVIVAAVFTTTAVPRLRSFSSAEAATLGMTTVAVATPALARTAPPATATPSGQLVVFSGQLLDVQHGFVFFTSGDGFRLAPDARVVDYDTKQPASPAATTGMFAQATFDSTGKIVELAVAKHKLPAATTYLDVHKFAVALSTPVPNPELNPNRPADVGGLSASSRIPLTGKVVQVRFYVRVPPTTPMSDPVYLTNDVSGWNPIAIRMERVDGLHYAVTLPLRTGTDFRYKYTRGSWQASERGRTGIEEPPRHFFMGASPLGEPDTAVRDDVVYNWSDFNPAGGAPVQPGSIPTPFNAKPFGFPTPFPTPTGAPVGGKPAPKAKN